MSGNQVCCASGPCLFEFYTKNLPDECRVFDVFMLADDANLFSFLMTALSFLMAALLLLIYRVFVVVFGSDETLLIAGSYSTSETQTHTFKSLYGTC